jgi:transposase
MKISGRHRSEITAHAWPRVRSYISTVGKHGDNVLTALHDAITGNPWTPPQPAWPEWLAYNTPRASAEPG